MQRQPVKSAMTLLVSLLSVPIGAGLIIGTPLQQSKSQHKQLVSAAARRVPPEAPFVKLEAWEAASQSLRPHANVLFGPTEVSGNQFVMLRVSCQRNLRPARWRCAESERMSFVFANDMSRAIYFSQDVDFVAAKAIYDEANRTCSIRYTTDEVMPDGITRAPAANEYILNAAGCEAAYRVVDGVVTLAATQWRIEV